MTMSDNLTRGYDANQSIAAVVVELRPMHATVIAGVFLMGIMLLAIFGNIAVILTIHLTALRDELSNLFITNLSITDLISATVVMMSSFAALASDRWPFGALWCNTVCAVNYCLIIVSMLTLCFISVDRHQAIAHHLQYPSRMTRPRITAMIAYAWFQGVVFASVPVALGWIEYDYWEVVCAIQWGVQHKSALYYVIVACLVCFLAPGLVLVGCYCRILIAVGQLKVTPAVAATPSADRASSASRARTRFEHLKKTINSLLIVIVAYFICTTPFSLTKFLKVAVPDRPIVPGYVNLAAAWVGYFSSAINPLIYGIFRRDFRNAFLRILRRALCPHLPLDSIVGMSRVTTSYTNELKRDKSTV